MKVKGDDSGEKIAHKKKKIKHTSLPENKNSTSDDMTLPEMKKGKKSKNIDAVVTEVESIDRDVVIKEKKKKKRSKSDAESLDDATSADVKNGDEASSKKKKKKKKLADDENPVEITENEEEAGMEKKPKKDKKLKKKSPQMKPENGNLEKGEVKKQKSGKDYLQEMAKESKNNVSPEVTEIKGKVKEKKKKKNKVNSEDNVKSEDETSVKKKKRKARTEVSENGVEIEKLEGENSVVQEVKLKKKKKKKKSVENEAELSQLEMDDCSILKSRDESTEGEIVVTEDEERKQKKKGKKEKNGPISLEVSEVEETEPKKKKKKKKGEKREHAEVKCEEVEEQSMETSKKKKKSSGQDVNSETSTKKKKVRKEETDEHELAQADVVCLSKKSGNTHEVNIKQERKPDSQMEVEQIPEPQKPAKPTGFGQWSSAQFNSSEQQQKFLRLMGGFKKSFQPSSESTGGGNMALGKDAQQQLQQGLLGEFERAQSRRMDFSNRGAGLGFTAPSNKKFSIDINASRSVRFDD